MKGLGVDVFIDLRNKSYTMTADVEVGANGNGVIVCQGGRFGGLSFYMKEGRPMFTYNYLGLNSTHVTSGVVLPTSEHASSTILNTLAAARARAE